MDLHLNHTRLLRYAGLFTWAMVGCWLVNLWLTPQELHLLPGFGEYPFPLLVARWMAVYLAFGLLYWWVTRKLGEGEPQVLQQLMLCPLNACAIGVSYFSSSGLGSILLMVVAGLLPWLLSVRVALLWLIAGNLAISPVFIAALGMDPLLAIIQSLAYVGFSSLVFVTAYVARQQAAAGDEQRRLNAELRATRRLLAESARVNERTRISRELHDLLGHHLTALSLNLEVAGHLVEGRPKQHVQQAHTLARLLLTDVREAVSHLREGGIIDLSAALRPLAENIPALDIHMDIQSPLNVDDPERAHVLLRCTQEIITNAVRHAGAANLWLSAREEDGKVRIDARDDGRGAEQLEVGNGLQGMRERLAQVGGSLRIETGARAGFRLHIEMPASATMVAAGQEARA